MPFRAYAPMVMTAQGGSIQANTQMGPNCPPSAASDGRARRCRYVGVGANAGQDIPGRVDLNAAKPTVLTDHPVALTPKLVVHDAKVSGAIGHPKIVEPQSGRSSMSGASQVALNTMLQTQEAVALIQSELAQKRQVDERILAAHAEAAIQAKRFRAAKETEELFKAQHFQTEADFAERLRVQRMQDEAERARWVDDVQRNTNMQIAILQPQMREMEAECDQEREAAKSIQKFQASQLRDLRATSSQVQHATVTPAPDAVSQIKTESEIANFQHGARSRDADDVAIKKEKSSDNENAAKQRTRTATTVPTAVKPEVGTKVAKPVPKSSDGAKVKAKKATPKTRASRKDRRGGYPSDSDPSSEDDDSNSSSDGSASSFCEPLSDMAVPKATQGGTTTMTIRPFVTASSLDDFDEKSSLSERTHVGVQGGWSDKMKVYELRLKLFSSARNWRSQLSPHMRRDWTRFSKEFKTKYCKSKMSVVECSRNVRQHDPSIRPHQVCVRASLHENVSPLLHMSDSEKYYTMKQRNVETPLDFLYRLNAAADRADIRYKMSE
ncbi:hypothetical protein PHMEG_00012147 [Phytophthora megakarya]|uniref:Uncharacterized protein n=1 Tax=Phytophthora megakarya TaxID=4795 RepID=A0A225WBL0_9STRA|nr:hypothetical protein PHMEG_00012147 [Phytophthora megakarya]